jgi:hypothetical protein
VARSGPSAKGSYVQTLTLMDIATGWTACAPLLVREQKLLTEVLSVMRPTDAVRAPRVRYGQRQRVMNETVRSCCDEAELILTRCHP